MATFTDSEVRTYLSRWGEIKRLEREQLRRTPMHVKFRQLAALMASASVMVREPGRETRDGELSARWTTIRRNSRV